MQKEGPSWFESSRPVKEGKEVQGQPFSSASCWYEQPFPRQG